MSLPWRSATFPSSLLAAPVHSSLSLASCSSSQTLNPGYLSCAMDPVNVWGNDSLETVDEQIFDLIEKEKRRQRRGIELIASENFTYFAVIQALGNPLTNKDSEGMPGNRYYGGNEFIDEIENHCRASALQAFRLDPPAGASTSSPTPAAPPISPPTPPSSIPTTASWASNSPVGATSPTGITPAAGKRSPPPPSTSRGHHWLYRLRETGGEGDGFQAEADYLWPERIPQRLGLRQVSGCG